MEKESKNFTITRVVTRDVVTDAFQGIRNFFGFRLRGYEKVINKHLKELLESAETTYEIEWYRLSINPLLKGSIMITIYGKGIKKDEE